MAPWVDPLTSAVRHAIARPPRQLRAEGHEEGLENLEPLAAERGGGLANGSLGDSNGADGARIGAGRVNGGQVSVGLVNGSGPLGSRVNGGRVNGGRVNGGRVNGGRVNGGRVNGGRVNGGRVNGGQVNGGRVNGGRVNGGRVNGGRVNGGRVNGGRVNGSSPFPTSLGAARWRRSRRNWALVVSALVVGVAFFLPLLGIPFVATPPVVIDGDFSDWAAISHYPDTLTDLPANAGINLVGFASISDEESVYIYAQSAQGTSFFADLDGSATTGRTVRVLIDFDRSMSTGYSAFGLGADFMVELAGDGGTLRTSSLKSYAASQDDRTDPTAFFQAGSVRAAHAGNQLELALPLFATRGFPATAPPLMLLLAQDSQGNVDVADVVFTTLPGALSIEHAGESPAVLPTDTDTLLLALRVRPIHVSMALDAVSLRVEGDGGGVVVSHVVYGGEQLEARGTAAVGESMTLPLTNASLQFISHEGAPRVLQVWGRAWGLSGQTALRLVATGGEARVAPDAGAGFSGHVSCLPPLAFSRSYVGIAPSAIRIDGAFADWIPWEPFDTDPTGDVTPAGGGDTPNGSNGDPSRALAAIDITASRALIEPGAGLASLYLAAQGSIMGSQELAPPVPPVRPKPSTPGTSGPGGAVLQRGDTATIYLDTDGSATTGWVHFGGLGVDAFVAVRGTGGGWGRTPVALFSTLGLWNSSTLQFDERPSDISVAFGSHEMEAQLPTQAICGGPCGAVRYVFHLREPTGGNDETRAFDSTTRSGGERLLLAESAGGVRNAYQGDLHVPVLSLSIDAPSTNNRTASLVGLHVVVTGAVPADITAVLLFADGATRGIVDPEDLAAGPSAGGQLMADGTAWLALDESIELGPGASFEGLIALDISRNATAPARLRASVADVRGASVSPPIEVSYSSDTTPREVRILLYSPGSRGQNNVVINEINFNAGWVELYHTLGTQVSLTSPSQMGLEVWRTNPPATKHFVTQIVLLGSTDTSGYAVINMSVIYSFGGQTYFLSLWCSNCSAGATAQGNNTTYVDSITLPTSTPNGMWGRYPNGNGTFRSTTNNTQGAQNQIPEFSHLVVTLGSTMLVIAVARRLRSRWPAG